MPTAHLDASLERRPEQSERFSATDALLFVNSEMARIQPVITNLIESRHKIFALPDTQFDTSEAIGPQLYTEPTYNHAFIKDDLGLRKGNTLEFHQETEKYNPQANDTPELAQDKEAYRQVIINAAHQIGGFIAEEPGTPATDTGKQLNILTGASEKIEQPVEAMVVASAKGLSSYKRFYDGILDIESGKVNTTQILFVAGDRPVDDAEKATVDAAGFSAGSTEYESSQRVVEQLLGVQFGEEEELGIPYEADLNARYVSTQAVIGNTLVDIKVVYAPVETGRLMADGNPARRTNTEETLRSLKELLSDEPGTIALKSHDAWIPYQHVKGIEVLGMSFGKQVVTSGPYNAERLYYREDTNIVDINSAEGVVDEIAKYQDDLAKLHTAALNEIFREHLDVRLVERLVDPPLPMEDLRARKSHYRELPIDSSHEKHTEPMVSISEYGIAGQSYYSRANAATGEAVPGVSVEVKVRQSIAEELSRINKLLNNPSIIEFFGGEVELYVEEGTRSVSVQQDLFDTHMPALIRKQSPEKTEEEVQAHTATLVAKPDPEAKTPTPHQTGGAIDVILRYKQDTPLFVAGSEVPMGHFDGNTATTNPDHFEMHTPATDDERIAQRNRRAFYNIMTGHAFGVETGLSVNPTEFWHWSRGDQLAMLVSGEPAYYSFPPEA